MFADFYVYVEKDYFNHKTTGTEEITEYGTKVIYCKKVTGGKEETLDVYRSLVGKYKNEGNTVWRSSDAFDFVTCTYDTEWERTMLMLPWTEFNFANDGDVFRVVVSTERPQNVSHKVSG